MVRDKKTPQQRKDAIPNINREIAAGRQADPTQLDPNRNKTIKVSSGGQDITNANPEQSSAIQADTTRKAKIQAAIGDALDKQDFQNQVDAGVKQALGQSKNTQTSQVNGQVQQGNVLPLAQDFQNNAEIQQQKVSKAKEILGIGAGDLTPHLGSDSSFGQRLASIPDNIGVVAKFATNIFDNLRAISTLGGKDTVEIQGVRANYDNLMTGLRADLTNAKAGDPVELDRVKKKLTLAYAQNERIAQTAHLKGLTNLRYWLKGGADLELEATINREIMDGMITDINNAFLQQQANQQVQNFRLP